MSVMTGTKNTSTCLQEDIYMLVKELLTQFFDAYLVKRDLKGALSFLVYDIISLGTGAHEIALNKKELERLMNSEFQSIPTGFQYEITQYCEHMYTKDLCGIYCSVVTSMAGNRISDVSFQTRLTMTAARIDGQWKIINLHMSTPSDQQEGEEFFPIKYGRQAIGKLDASASKKLIETMLSMLPGGIMGGYLEKGFPLYIINDTMLNYLGYTYDELVENTGEEMQKIIAPEDWERVERTIYESIEKTGEYDVQYRIIRKDGTRLWVDDKGHEITTEDGRKAMISVMLDISENIKLQDELRKEAMEDSLTGLLNRKGAIFYIEQSLLKNHPGAMFLLDIDNFKQLNDTYGHQAGDQVLRILGKILKSNSREGDVSARIGGDEFILFLPGCTRQDILNKRADRICSDFRKTGSVYNDVELSISIGIAVSDDAHDFDQLFKLADKRLYAVKKNGKDNFR